MAYKPCSSITVEELGATWHFKAVTSAIAEFWAEAARVAGDKLNTAMIPGAVFPAADKLFEAAIVGWEGVEKSDGTPLLFSRAALDDIPTLDRITVVGTYLERLLGIESGKDEPAASPT